jgi:hypothetical protein
MKDLLEPNFQVQKKLVKSQEVQNIENEENISKFFQEKRKFLDILVLVD